MRCVHCGCWNEGSVSLGDHLHVRQSLAQQVVLIAQQKFKQDDILASLEFDNRQNNITLNQPYTSSNDSDFRVPQK